MRETQIAPNAKQEILNEMRAAAAPNGLDRVISYVAPVWGARRMRARMTQALAGGYVGGSRSRRATSEWQTRGGSAIADLMPDLQVLRNRSRDLVRNDAIAGGAVNTMATNVVGTGLSLQSRVNRTVLRMTEEQAAAWQNQVELEFSLWGGNADCDITRTQNFYELQDLVFRSTLESGDIVVLLPSLQRSGNPYGLKLQAIEADRLVNPNFQIDKPTLAGGVEMDEMGAPVRYHILDRHPGELIGPTYLWTAYDAFGPKTGRRNVLHVFKRLRPGQPRGEPFLAPVIELLKQIGRYTEAEIMAAVVSGLFTVFVHSEGPGLDLANQQTMGKETNAQPGDTDAKMASGAIVDLNPNEKVDFANPSRPNTAFDPFMMAIMRQVGMRLGIPFEVLVMHFTASYSAARAAMLTAWRFFMVRRGWLAGIFCQPVYETFLAEAVARGRIAAPGFFTDPLMRMAYCCAEWQGDGMPAISPLQEADAAEKRINIGLSTLQTETAAYDGRDWQSNHEQRVRENDARKKAGLMDVTSTRITIPETPMGGVPPGGAAPGGGNSNQADQLEPN